jgi:hypothetical protein
MIRKALRLRPVPMTRENSLSRVFGVFAGIFPPFLIITTRVADQHSAFI